MPIRKNKFNNFKLRIQILLKGDLNRMPDRRHIGLPFRQNHGDGNLFNSGKSKNKSGNPEGPDDCRLGVNESMLGSMMGGIRVDFYSGKR